MYTALFFPVIILSFAGRLDSKRPQIAGPGCPDEQPWWSPRRLRDEYWGFQREGMIVRST